MLVDDLLVVEHPLLPLAAPVLHGPQDDLRDLEPRVPKADYHPIRQTITRIYAYMQVVRTYRIAFSSVEAQPLRSTLIFARGGMGSFELVAEVRKERKWSIERSVDSDPEAPSYNYCNSGMSSGRRHTYTRHPQSLDDIKGADAYQS